MEELIALLEKFQHAYTARDLTMAESFIDEVFVAQEPAPITAPVPRSNAWARAASCA